MRRDDGSDGLADNASSQYGDSAHTTLNPNAPLSSWRPFAQGPYPSNEMCQSAIKAEVEADRREGSPSASHFGFQMAQCVSSDDPRLKGN